MCVFYVMYTRMVCRCDPLNLVYVNIIYESFHLIHMQYVYIFYLDTIIGSLASSRGQSSFRRAPGRGAR